MPSPSAKSGSQELMKNMALLKESAQRIHDAVAESEPFHHGWGSNPLFEEKLKLHRKLTSLVHEQEALASGIVALIKSVHDFEHERLRRAKHPLPPAPWPTRSATLPPDAGLSSLGKSGRLPSLKGDPSFDGDGPVKKKGLKALFGGLFRKGRH
ncbi:MAG: hypothetical protein GXP63_06090 [DPANN group archaeon]|nr:hypothetical protein [DPANN group archaeon]